ncbi:MAG TPA: Gfo/Idh/MocA family oxidoreductase [Streptosporangiaceae bacterium]|nr:Gfo/Idh/MocA family oxidoreductase [Streptosporangiaceae bacterium]
MVELAIIGAGIMGGHHARIARSTPGTDVTFVVDKDEEKGRQLASHVGAEFLPSIDQLDGRVDAAIVSVPTDLHAEIGLQLLESGLDVLIEKPIASTVEEAKELVAAAERTGRILMVGHVEQFNPAVIEVRRHVADPVHIDVKRVGPFSPRVPTGVALDLMIHDVDLVISLTGSRPVQIASVVHRLYSANEDFAACILTFATGVSAVLTASRVSQTKQRQIEITQRENYIVADLVRQQVTIHRLQHAEFVDERGAMYRQSGVIEIPYLDHQGEPLALEQRHFIDCVVHRTQPAVSGEDGLTALDTAIQIRDQAIVMEDARFDPAGT